MQFEAACQQLHEWILQSNGKPIVLPSGSDFAFISLARYAETDLKAFEQQWSLAFPAEYRYFLLHVGACEVYTGGSNQAWGIEFHCLDAIEERYTDFFELPEELLTVYLPVTRRITHGLLTGGGRRPPPGDRRFRSGARSIRKLCSIRAR